MAERFDPGGTSGPDGLRVNGWAWYSVGSMLFLVGTETANPRQRPALMDGTPPPFWRVSELARIVEDGDPDPWRVQVARRLLSAVVADLAADPGFR
ncbi:MAG: hypothetical protein GEU73_03165 [Chloroflexi bacterium]|nr:hypothetical protein [Chloroflexota bacterium]